MTEDVYRGYDQKALDWQYDTRGRVAGGFKGFFDSYVAASEATRAALRSRLDVVYGPGEMDKVDIFLPDSADDNAGLAPVQVFFHGGYWRALSKTEFSYVARPITAAGGVSIVVDFGLIPAIDMDQLVRQCRTAVAWIYRNAESFGGDPDRLFVSGHSAGGQLLGMLAATDWASEFGLPATVVRGGVSISGLFDLEPIRLCFLNEVLGLTEDQVRRNSPIHLPAPPPMPMILTYGTDESEEYIRQSAIYAEHLRAHGLTPELRPIAGRHHFNMGSDLGDPGSELSRLITAQMGLSSRLP